MGELAKIAEYAGPIALAAFAGTLLGGIVLSFFWKNFGPWKLLEAAKEECRKCQEERAAESSERTLMLAEFTDLKARYNILIAAVEHGGLGLQLGPRTGD